MSAILPTTWAIEFLRQYGLSWRAGSSYGWKVGEVQQLEKRAIGFRELLGLRIGLLKVVAVDGPVCVCECDCGLLVPRDSAVVRQAARNDRKSWCGMSGHAKRRHEFRRKG